jgi:chromosomal replication initiator protein
MPVRPVAPQSRNAASVRSSTGRFLVHSVPHSPAWAACLTAFERELTPQQFATWIRPLACANEAGRLRLIAPNRFVLQWVKDRFGGRIETLARQATGESLAVEFAVADAAAPATAKAAFSAPTVAAEPAIVRNAPSIAAPAPTFNGAVTTASTGRRGDPGSLNPSFTFGSFVAGKANQLARAAG